MSKTFFLFRLFVFGLFVFTTIFLFNCNNKKNHEDGITIYGKLKNTNGEKIYLLQLKIDSLKPIDSVKIDDDGKFTFKYKPKEISFYILQISKDNFITLLADKGETIEITGNVRQLANEYQIKGSPGSELLWELNNFTRRNYRKVDSLFKILSLHQDSADYPQIKFKHDTLVQEIFFDQQKNVISFITKNSNSLASLIALYQFFGRQKVLNEREHFQYFKMLDSSLRLLYPDNDYVKELHERVVNVETAKKEKLQNLAKLDSGMPAPEITMKNIGGALQPLSSLKGHYVLVFFWAGNNQNCINVLPQFKWIYKTFSPKGFQIYAVSLDENRYIWENSVRQHKLKWIHVSDLMGWNSPVVKEYCVDYIPYALLIDRNGNIVKRGINTQELANFLYKTHKLKKDTVSAEKTETHPNNNTLH